MEWGIGKARRVEAAKMQGRVVGGAAAFGMFVGGALNAEVQNLHANGFWAAALGAHIGLTGLQYGQVAHAAAVGGVVGAVGAIVVMGVGAVSEALDLRKWRANNPGKSDVERRHQKMMRSGKMH